MIEMGRELGWETDYVVSVYPPPPHTIHPPHQIATILEESVIVLRRLRIHSDNIVYYMVMFEAHQYFSEDASVLSTPRPNFPEFTGLW